MSFITKANKNKPEKQKRSFFKTRSKKIALFIVSLVAVFIVSFLSYLYATGSKIFDGSGSSILKVIKGEQSEGFKQDRVNILLMGRGGENHPGGLLTDSIMMISFMPKENKMALLSIPRDLLVPIKDHGQDKLNSAYADGYNDYLNKSCNKKNKKDCVNDAMASGARMTTQTVSDVLGVPIHYYAVLDFSGFEKFIDTIGGVDIYVEKSIYDPYYPDDRMQGYSPFSIKAGQQHLDGKTALKYARSRETTSDFDRARRQQQILSAVKEKALNAGILANPKKIVEITNIIGDHFRTDMSASDIRSLVEVVKNIDSGSVINKVLSNASDGPLISDSSSGTYYLKPKAGNYDAIKNIVRNIFQTNLEEKATIEILNGSKTAGSGSKLGTVIENLGYEVVSIETSKEKYQKTIIYDNTNGSKKQSVEFMKNGLNADVINKKSDAKPKADITIIIGDDYAGFKTQK